MKVSEMSKKQLEEEYIAVVEAIEKIGCYRTKDVMWRYALENEIDKRGLTIEKEITLGKAGI